MERPEAVDFQAWNMAVNVLNKDSRPATEAWGGLQLHRASNLAGSY
jgi:hypothetical protein